jgi:hypothetical protein
MSTNPSVKTVTVPFWWSKQRIISIPKLTLVLFASSLLCYLLFLPDIAYQPWDSLDYAYSTEAIGIITMRGNHPLGHVIHYLAFSLAKVLGYNGRALFITQIINSLAGSITVALFFWVLAYQLRVKTLSAFGCSIMLGVSYGFWFFTGTADIYTISLLFILLTWASLIHEVTLNNRLLPIASGIFTGISIVSHQLNILMIPMGMFLILLTPGRRMNLKQRTEQLIAFPVIATITFISGYVMLGFIATSSQSLLRVIGWARGYFGDPTYGRYLNVEHFFDALSTASQTIIKDGNLLILLTLLATMLFGLVFNKSLDENRRPIWIISTLQSLVTWILILWWEPQNMKFWILTLVPWILSLALSFEAVDSKFRDGRLGLNNNLTLVPRAFPALIGILILAVNFPVIARQHNPQNADAIAFHHAMDLWMQHSDTDSVLITAGDLVPHLLYWGDRPDTIILYRSLQVSQSSPDDFADLRTNINRALCEHRTVLLTPAASEFITDNELSVMSVSRESLRIFFNGYTQRGKIAFWYENRFDHKRVPVYTLTNSEACNANE